MVAQASDISILNSAVEPTVESLIYPIKEMHLLEEYFPTVNHRYHLYEFETLHRANFLITLKIKCEGSSHFFAAPNDYDYIVQNQFKTCVDCADASKTHYRRGWQTSHMVELAPDLTGVLFRNLAVLIRQKVPVLRIPIRPSLARIIKESRKMEQRAITDILYRMGIDVREEFFE
jgi:hypothetical protein